jgi:hypothetical protein
MNMDRTEELKLQLKELRGYVCACGEMLPTVPNAGNLLPVKIKRLKEENERLKSNIDSLATTLGNCIVAAGITEPSALTGPQLLHFGSDLKAYLENGRAQAFSEIVQTCTQPGHGWMARFALDVFEASGDDHDPTPLDERAVAIVTRLTARPQETR